MRRRAAVLILMAVTLIPPAAAADSRCSTRLHGTLSGFVTLTPATGTLSGEATGMITPLGRVTGVQAGTVTPAPGGATGRTTWTIKAKGGTLTGTAQLTVVGSPTTAHTTTMDATITGGTGRYRHARGTFGPPVHGHAVLLGRDDHHQPR